MGKNIFTEAHFHDEAKARAWFEAARWPTGAYCPKCGCLDPYKTKKIGVYRCKEKTCRKDFTVMTGTVMERSHANGKGQEMLSFEKWMAWLETKADELRANGLEVRFFSPKTKPEITTSKPSAGIQFKAEKTICDFSVWNTGECDYTVNLIVGPKKLEMVSHKWGLTVTNETFESTFEDFLAEFRFYETEKRVSR